MVIEFFMAMVPPTVTHQEKQVHVVKGNFQPCYSNSQAEQWYCGNSNSRI